MVSDCLFVLLSRSRCYRGYLGKEEKGCVAQRFENFSPVLTVVFRHKEQDAGEVEKDFASVFQHED